MERHLARLLDRWTDVCLRHPWRVLLLALLLALGSTAMASRLTLKSDFIELLPTDAPSVVNLEAMKTRVASYATLTVAIESTDLKASQRFADDLVARLKQYPPERIKYVDYNVNDLKEFYKTNRYLWADLSDLVDFRDRLKKRIAEETQQNAFESLDDTPAPKTDLRVDEMKAKYEKKSKEQDRYVDGYYTNPDRTLTAVFIRPPSGASTFEKNERLVADVQKDIAALDPAKYDPAMTVGLTGDVKTGLEERDAIADDATFISILCLFLILGVIIAYYRSLRSVILIGTPMLIGLLGSLGVAWLAVGYLNTATVFLVSIIAGNGINFMIMLAARFFEETRARGADTLDASLRISVKGSMAGTAVASLAAAIAYGSLMLAGFRGFRQFGIIGGAGMLLCWLSTFAFGPALIVVLHRWRPLAVRHDSRHPVATRLGTLVTRWPRGVLVAAMLMTAGSILVAIPWSFDPFEYHFKRLRNRESIERGSAKLSRKVDKIFDLPQSPTPIIVDRVDAAPVVKQAILDHPGYRSVVGGVKTLQDILPARQEEKLAVLADIRGLIDRKIDFLSARDREEIEKNRPPEGLKVLTLADIPDVVARPFTDSDGTRGRVVYVYSHKSESLLDGRYLLKFARFLRTLDVPGVSQYAVGQPMVFADMIAAVLHDGVVVTIASVTGVLLLLVVVFRSRLAIGTVMTSTLLGTAWMIGFAALFQQKLNFLNFVVIPITLGISVDYGANIFSRYRMEGPGRMPEVLKSTGGAVVLSAATTILGYATLITSTNMALQSFGLIADIGEFTSLAAAEIVMPALIVWLENSRRRAPGA